MDIIIALLIIVLASAVFLLVGGALGCLLAGVDRKITARMQGRVGPPLLQPYYDVRKLLGKQKISVSGTDGAFIALALLCTVLAGGIFFSGGNFLLVVFVITLSALFFIVAAYSTCSPFAEAGAAREIVQVMAYEPMVLLMCVVFYQTTGSFMVESALFLSHPMICFGWAAFLGLLFILTIKLRKSPFDLSYSHHAHQELVKGITTEMSGSTLAMVEIMHWCENILFLGWVALFFVYANPVSLIIALIVVALIYFFEIWIDNNFARVKWQAMLKWAWIIAFVAGGINVAMLAFI